MANPQSTLRGDYYVNGTLRADAFIFANGAISDAQVAPMAAISASKLQHEFQARLEQERATDAAVEGRMVHEVTGATATVVSFGVSAVVAAGASTSVTVDLLKNGVSILSAAVTLDNTTAAYATKAGTVASPNLVVGDKLEIRITAVTGSNKPKGVAAVAVVRQDAQ